ncbi:uncharacterized protein N7529_000105 [Penicillium soppii]|jgi:hypothetical protein|uniref:uncharacterized protein n=1 Tax=Penicillium soppii TaxID=69789 RepID=UPI0025482E65|nr:uncharacterized protein N7529_000105 [Penicillium soppii]KAJ5881433.1 hypothetical protein N7529_000105 [Penicillium soppii]
MQSSPSLRNAKERESIAYSQVPLSDPTPFSDSISFSDAISFSDTPLSNQTPSNAVPPSYNDVSGPVIIDQDGKPKFLSPEEEVERQRRLETVVREKMLGLPRTTTFEWHQGTSASEELQLPPYTPKEEKK